MHGQPLSTVIYIVQRIPHEAIGLMSSIVLNHQTTHNPLTLSYSISIVYYLPLYSSFFLYIGNTVDSELILFIKLSNGHNYDIVATWQHFHTIHVPNCCRDVVANDPDRKVQYCRSMIRCLKLMLVRTILNNCLILNDLE